MPTTLSESIRARTPSLAEAQTNYKENVVAVNTLVNSVMTSALPTLNSYPPDWTDFVTAHTQAQTAALAWVNQVLARLLEVPDDVQNYNATVVGYLADAVAQAQVLVDNPDDQPALTALKADLKGVTGTLNLVNTFIAGCIAGIQKFKNGMPAMAADLSSIAAKSIADAKADQGKIDDLNTKIQNLNKDISNLTAAIVGLAIADGIALTIGIVATIALWPVGALVWFVMGPAVVAATTFIALDALQIEQDKAAIAAAQEAITGITADVSVLSILSKNYTAMSENASGLDASLQAILQEWQALESDVTEAVTDIGTALQEADQKVFQQVLAELQATQGAWHDAYDQAGALHLDLQVNDAQLEPGMSSEQVQAALADGKTFGVIEYYNRVGAAA